MEMVTSYLDVTTYLDVTKRMLTTYRADNVDDFLSPSDCFADVAAIIHELQLNKSR